MAHAADEIVLLKCKCIFVDNIEMSSFRTKLLEKIQSVRSFYAVEEDENDEEIVIDIRSGKTFASMERWHRNSHMTDTDWLTVWNTIKCTMTACKEELEASIPVEIIEYLEKKFKKNDLANLFSISDIFSDELTKEILNWFKLLSKSEGSESEEFDVQLTSSPHNIELFNRRFLPFAIYSIYRQKHSESPVYELLHDCFDIGAGSMRDDLFPEVNAYCEDCSGWNFALKKKNMKIFRCQLENQFKIPIDDSDSELDEPLHNNCIRKRFNVSSSSDSEDDSYKPAQKVFNPFLFATSWGSDEDPLSREGDVEAGLNNISEVYDVSQGEDQPGRLSNVQIKLIPRCERSRFSCNKCPKKFSKELYLEFHENIFHKENSKLQVAGKHQLDSKINYQSVEIDSGNELSKSCDDDVTTIQKQISPKKLEIKVANEPLELITSFYQEDYQASSRQDNIRGKLNRKSTSKKIKKSLFK